jgi:iron(III) transport system ATP-binding protein
MRVQLTQITKRFGAVRAIDGISLAIEEGEFFTLLGPSGCGKTTLLRSIAGFHTPEAGEIRFGDRVVNAVPPHRRETGMVFQNYALFPHLTVFDNVAYGLRARRVASEETAARVTEVLKSVQLEGFGRRSPGQLSGGQQQRVALARALVIKPQILLMDEPLSNLDAKLRVSMRDEIRRLQKQLGITTIYVTHDQEEAMAVSDRIAILNRGRVEQVGSPAAIYFRPESRFAAEFMGASNILELPVAAYDEARSRVIIDADGRRLEIAGERPTGRTVTLSVRPEWITVVPAHSTDDDNVLEATVLSSSFLGSMVRYRVSGPAGHVLTIEMHHPEEGGLCADGGRLRYRIPPERPVFLRA